MKEQIESGESKQVAGFVHPKPGEMDQISTGKLRDFLKLQKDYRAGELARIYKEEVLMEMTEILDKVADDEFVNYAGVRHKARVWKAEYNVQANEYSLDLTKINNIKDALLKYGLTSEQINSIKEDKKYIKEIPGDVVDDGKKDESKRMGGQNEAGEDKGESEDKGSSPEKK